MQPDLSPIIPTTDGIWVTGAFVGDLYSRSSRIQIDPASGTARTYPLQLHRGTLRNIRQVAAPQISLAPSEAEPLRQARVPHVRIGYGGRSEVDTQLIDFRLHECVHEGMHEESHTALGNGHAMARVRGRAYGFIARRPLPDEELSPPLPRSVEPADVDQPPETVETPAHELEPPSTKPLKEPEASPSTAEGCWICDWRVRLALAVLMGLSVGWMSALLGVLGLGWLMCLLDRFRADAGKGFGTERPRWMLALVLLALAGLGLSRIQTNLCSLMGAWALALPLAAVLLGAWSRYCWFKTLLFVLWLATLQAGFALGDCRQQLPAAQESTQSKPVESTPSVQEAPARASFFERLKSGVEAVRQQLNTWLYFDQASASLSQATEADDRGRRLSVNDAVANPKLLEDCRNSLYFPSLAMFELNSDEINPAVHGQLARLERIAKVFPDRQFLIVGHSDQTGQETPDGVYFNILLSEKRAIAVANWLAENAGWPIERTEVQGVGSKFPVLNLPGEIGINRRVELRLKCK